MFMQEALPSMNGNKIVDQREPGMPKAYAADDDMIIEYSRDKPVTPEQDHCS